MIISVAKEIKNQEKRVAMIPGGVLEFVESGHTVLVEKSAGIGSGYPDEQYEQAGAKIVSVNEVWKADIVMKVKEPQPSEYKYFRKDLILFTFLHLAGVPKELTQALLKAETTGIAYETVQGRNGNFPLLMPMSAIAGKMAVQMASHYLSHLKGGRGVLIDGMPGVHSGKVIILGGGSVGTNAAIAALGRGAKVTVIDRDLSKLTYLEATLSGKLTTLMSNYYNIRAAVKNADVVIGSALVSGQRAPVLVKEEMLKRMKSGSVVVDVAIDQGGCIETSRPTSHDNPVFEKHGIIHYCVSNMPGAYPRTATKGLANATISYLSLLANKGFEAAIKEDIGFAMGVNTYKGHLTNQVVAKSLKMENKYKNLLELL